MKKLAIITIIGTSLLWNGCSDSFIDLNPPLNVVESDVFTDSVRLESSVLGIYASFKGPTWIGGKTYVAFDNRGDDIYNIGTNIVTLYDTYYMNVGTSYAENTDGWRQAYLTINRANVIIEGLDTYEAASLIGATKADLYKAEAKFVRALTYYYLVQLFSKPYVIDPNAKAVPLRLTGIIGPGYNDEPRATISQIYNQILADLDNTTISALPNTPNTYNTVTRATQGAAYMLKQRVYMAMENWGEAIAAGEAITGYGLEGLPDMFRSPYYTKETIFALPMSTNDRGNIQQAPSGYYYSEQICLVDTQYGIMSKPAYSLDTDIRKIEFIGGEGEKLIKWDDSSERLQWLPVFRYAETLLNLAECYAKTDQPAKAQAALAQVRSRAIPTGDILNVTSLTGNALLTAIEDEKRVEFLGEGMRGIEIIRKGQTFTKRGGEISSDPNHSGYVWPIPNIETLVNGAIND